MKEIEIWSSLHKQIGPLVYADFHRVEAWNKAGFPDINGCYKGTDLWIESKSASQSGKVKFRPMQIPWLDRRRRAGGNVYVAVATMHEILYIYDAADAMEIDEHGVFLVDPLFMFAQPWNWIEILDYLTQYPLPVLGG